MPLSFEAGEAYQFDWSHEVVRINNATVTPSRLLLFRLVGVVVDKGRHLAAHENNADGS